MPASITPCDGAPEKTTPERAGEMSAAGRAVPEILTGLSPSPRRGDGAEPHGSFTRRVLSFLTAVWEGWSLLPWGGPACPG
jgi:hypothetical protein